MAIMVAVEDSARTIPIRTVCSCDHASPLPHRKPSGMMRERAIPLERFMRYPVPTRSIPINVLTVEKIMRRTILAGLALLSLGLSPAAQAQTYPNRPVTLVVAFTPAGPSDV